MTEVETKKHLLKKLGAGSILIGLVAISLLAAGVVWFVVSSKQTCSVQTETLFRDTDAAANLMLDAFQVGLVETRKRANTDVIAVNTVKLLSLDDIFRLGIRGAPTNTTPNVQNFRFVFLNTAPMEGAPGIEELKGWFQARPLIAYPQWAACRPAMQVPVLLVHPSDRFIAGTKAARIKWMAFKEIAELVAGKTVEPAGWDDYDRKTLKRRLDGQSMS